MSARRLFIDTNLLLLLFVGTASETYIAAHRRTRIYTIDDFALLKLVIGDAAVFVTTPNVLAETSNLIRQFDQTRLAPVLQAFRGYAEAATETYVPSAVAVNASDFDTLGLNDISILDAQESDVTLITDGLHLYLTSAMSGRKALNFTHERERILG
ncbi:hypothetical protein [Methylobacterium sp. WL120]|uniref:hypothetical protein n=1 Tax=Methylobacterium sp. WL120 TaxID=2603887 RepID=UPI0011CC56EF|nr:hypothetical protein [Methylobacterium sp. WL120]TXM69260.1 hypothetical protein FV229_05635 [Methylobacterium sp. WL120]